MTVETVTCGDCGARVPLDIDHAKVTVEVVHMEDRNESDQFVLCMDCAMNQIVHWDKPL